MRNPDEASSILSHPDPSHAIPSPLANHSCFCMNQTDTKLPRALMILLIC